ncbi:MAG: hypothetical protein WBP72_05245 [Rhodocyclaceae bacterium]
MPRSVADPALGREPAGRRLAITAESLYLVNLMLAPGFAFAVLAWLWFKHRRSAPLLARGHLEQTFRASLWAGGLLVAASTAVVLLGGVRSMWVWVVAILWFVCVHATLVLLGVLGLVAAMGGKPFVFPLVGKSNG